MSEEEVKNLIQQALEEQRIEMEAYMKFLSDKVVFNKDLKIASGRNIILDTANGIDIGAIGVTDTELGFYGVTKVDQPETVADPSDVGALYVGAEVQESVDAIKAIIARLKELGLIK